MKLLLDIGNTRVKWALSDADGMTAAGNFVHRGLDADEIIRNLEALDTDVAGVVIACVAGETCKSALDSWADSFDAPVYFVSSIPSAHGVKNAYSDPGNLGVDRWVALISAWHRWVHPNSRNALIVDAGTALTVDALTVDGRHLGGLIAPGIWLMRAALLDSASGIEASDDMQSESPFQQDTAPGVGAGTLLSAAGLIEFCFRELQAMTGEAPQVILTGAEGDDVSSMLSFETIYDPALVLEGLALIAAEDTHEVE